MYTTLICKHGAAADADHEAAAGNHRRFKSDLWGWGGFVWSPSNVENTTATDTILLSLLYLILSVVL